MIYLISGKLNVGLPTRNSEEPYFNYKIEPLPGKFPAPKLGPFTLLKDTRMNWYGKLGFEWLYWNVLLAGRHPGMPPTLVMAGKEIG
jgi:sulfide:quinone oxidoreductase